MDPDPQEVLALVADGCVDLVQLHGSEPPQVCSRFPGRAIKARPIAGPEDVSALAAYAEVVQAFLLDAYHPTLAGGTGRTFNWRWLEQPLSRPLILAGGLTPENVGLAIRTAHPWAVDVSSGVERSPGVKDATLMREFVAAAREAGS